MAERKLFQLNGILCNTGCIHCTGAVQVDVVSYVIFITDDSYPGHVKPFLTLTPEMSAREEQMRVLSATMVVVVVLVMMVLIVVMVMVVVVWCWR